jgi:hypothetical protein
LDIIVPGRYRRYLLDLSPLPGPITLEDSALTILLLVHGDLLHTAMQEEHAFHTGRARQATLLRCREARLVGATLVAPDPIPKGRHMDPNERTITEAWATSRFSPDELRTLRALIRTHDRRLHELRASVTPEMVVDAVLVDAVTDPALAAALKRATQMDVARKMQRAAQN